MINRSNNLKEKHCFNFNIFSMRGSNTFGGVLIATHKSINVRRVTKFDKVPNLLVLEVGTVPETVQLVTCYSPPTETIPFELFDYILQNNPNTIFTGNFNAKYKAWSRSVENQKLRELYNWLTLMRIRFNYDVINKFIATSTRSNATIDLTIAPTQISTNSFAVLPSIGNDHHPIVWRPSLKIKCAYQYHPVYHTYRKLFEVFLTFTASYWQSLATVTDRSADFFSLYERFLSLCLSRFTTITLYETVKPSLPTHIVTMLKHKRFYPRLFRRTRHPIFVVLLRHISKDLRKELFMYKRKMWENYYKSFDRCDTKAFWKKAKLNFNSRSPLIEGFLYGNIIVSTPAKMCEVAKSYYEDQFQSHPSTQGDIDRAASTADDEIETMIEDKPLKSIVITYQHLQHAIKSLKNKNSTGIDKVSNRGIKSPPHSHISIILPCFNKFATKLQMPQHWHVAKMILLSKTKSKIIPVEDTRPISLLPCFSKVYEKCFLIHFRQWIAANGILPPERSGFRPGHNMAMRLVAIINQIG